MIKEVFRASAAVLNCRTSYNVLGALMEEVGELSQEVNIINNASYKEKGPDGVIGESIDVIICALDMIYVNNPKVTEEEIMTIVKNKLTKWKEKSFAELTKKRDVWVKVKEAELKDETK